MNPPPVVFLAVGFAVIAVFGIVAAVRHDRRTRAAREDAYARLEIEVTAKPTTEGKREAFAPLEHLKRTLPGGAKGLRRIARGTRRDRAVQILTHVYSSGNTTAVHTVLCTPCPPAWPLVGLTREHVGHKIAEALGGAKDLQVEDPVFNDTFRIRTDDEVFATLALNPAVQRHLLQPTRPAGNSKRRRIKETWSIGNGSIALVLIGNVKPDALEDTLDRLVTLPDLLPRELDAYAPPATPQ